LRDAVQWSFASLEAAIDELRAEGVLPRDLSALHQLLNEERKAMFYEGEDPDLGELTIEEVIREVETAVRMAEAESE
jgi:hypothetical protein